MPAATAETLAEKVGTRWRKISRRVRWTILALLIVLVSARLALPYAIKFYVNQQFHKLPDYAGEVRRVDVHLWRGAYQIRDIAITKTGGQVPVPFFSASNIDLSLQWGELFHGAAVGRIRIERPDINFVGGSTPQNGTNQPWEETFQSLFPLRFNQFEVSDGVVHFRNFEQAKKVNIFLTNLDLVATNLSNARNQTGKLPGGLKANGRTLGGGQFQIDLKLNPVSSAPTFELNAAVSNVDLVALNDFMRSYGKFDVARGNFSLFTSVASAEGKYDGFVKVLFKNLDIFEWDKERKKNILAIFWEGIVGVLVEGFKNHPHDQLATQIPITGTYTNTSVGVTAAVGNLLKNAFIRALLPTIGNPVHVEDAEKKSEPPVSAVSSPRTTH